MKTLYLKNKKGVTMMDLAIAVTILSVFTGIVGRLYVLIAQNNIIIRQNAIATYYVVRIAEDIDKMTYEEVTNALNIMGKGCQIK